MEVIMNKTLLNDKEWLYQEYVINKKSTKLIAKEINCSKNTVNNALQKFNIQLRCRSEAKKLCPSYSKYELLNNKEWLYKEYIVEKNGMKAIAKKAGLKTSNSVRQSLIRHGIEVRSISDGLTINREDDGFLFNETSMQVINGSLLGDASLRKYNNSSSLSNAYFAKKNIHYDHIGLVGKNIFGSNWESMVTIDTPNKLSKKPAFIIRSYSHKELNPLFDSWYPASNNFKKLVPKDLIITPLVLLHWFMDDGTSYRRKRKYKTSGKWQQVKRRNENQIVISFACESFTKEDQEFLAGQLINNFGLRARVSECKTSQKSNRENYHRIFIPQSNADLFFNIIGECPVPSMEYKWKLN
jgi:hypothetical protein